MRLSGTCNSSPSLICSSLIYFLELQKKFQVLPSFIAKKTLLSSTTRRAHVISSKNVMSSLKKMHIACNYELWRVHCSILNSMGKCAKHIIVGRVKCNKPLYLYLFSYFKYFVFGVNGQLEDVTCLFQG